MRTSKQTNQSRNSTIKQPINNNAACLPIGLSKSSMWKIHSFFKIMNFLCNQAKWGGGNRKKKKTSCWVGEKKDEFQDWFVGLLVRMHLSCFCWVVPKLDCSGRLHF